MSWKDMLLSSADRSDLMSTVLPLPMGQSVTPSRGKMEGRDSSGSSSLNMMGRYLKQCVLLLFLFPLDTYRQTDTGWFSERSL